jgi:2-polyprenyl-6-methoxyphenol hydroxylase-like FAD-dependent oxidoreductase
MSASATEVLIVGAGPVGLTMAAELARHGVRSRIIDKLPAPLPFCRAIGVTPRTLELWDDMDVVRDMIDAGVWLTGRRRIINGQVHDEFLNLADLPYAVLGLPQYETERILTRHLARSGIQIDRGLTLEALTTSNGQVQVVLGDANSRRETLAFRYVIGCDGAHSLVRRALSIPFEGSAIPAQFVLGDVHVDWELPRGMSLWALRPAADGPPDLFIAIPLPEPGRYRVSTLAPPELAIQTTATDHGIQSERAAPGIEPLQAAADRLVPEKPNLSDLRWSSIFRISMRLAARYRQGNAFLAGDAAHIHPPTGGQGMNTGIQDAYNLAWKLALVLKGQARDSLLDSYELERRPVGESVIAATTAASMRMAQPSSGNSKPGSESAEAIRLADTQLLVHYRGSPLVAGESAWRPTAGDRVPDCTELRRAGVGHALRLHDILRGPEHVVIQFLPSPEQALNVPPLPQLAASLVKAGWLRTATIVGPGLDVASSSGAPCYSDSAGNFLKLFGAHDACLLVRPDGYLAWRGPSFDEASFGHTLGKTFRPGEE